MVLPTRLYYSFTFVLALHLVLLSYWVAPLLMESDEQEKTVLRLKLKQSESKQIVQTRRKQESTPKQPADYLSEFDNQTDRQTRAARVDRYNEGGGAQKTSQKPKPIVPTQRKGLGKLALTEEMIEEVHQEMEREKTQAGQGRGISSSNDYLEKLPLGDLNELNTQEYKFYGYYMRIREKLEQFWGMTLEEKSKAMFRAGRRIASDQDLITNLKVVLNPSGEVTEIRLVTSSGYQELDQAAVESFNRAGPFPFPPKDLVKKGYAEIDWGFVVKN